jgi:hypothetical protein
VDFGLHCAGSFFFDLGYREGVMAPASTDVLVQEMYQKYREIPKDYPTFSAWAYSIDAFIPFLDLVLEHYWIPNADAGWCWGSPPHLSVDPYQCRLDPFHPIPNRRYRYHPKVRVKGHKLMITVHNLPDTLRAGLTEAEKQILEMGKDKTSISFWPSPAAYAHLVLEKHVKALKEAGFSTESLGSHAAPEKPELTQKSEGLAPIGETTEDEAEGSTVGGEVAGAIGKAGDWMEVIKEGGSWDSARTIRAAFLGYLLGEGFFPKGLIIVGARLVGPWQWKGAFPAHGLALIGCYLEGPIQLTEVEAPGFSLFLGSCYIANPEEDNAKTNSPLLLLQQTQLRNLYFEDCRIGGPIHLKGFRTVQGKVSLVKTLIPSSEVALQIENTVCERDLWLSEAHFGGAVHLKDVKVKRGVSIKSSRIESSSNVALHVEDVEVGGSFAGWGAAGQGQDVTLEGSQLVGGVCFRGGQGLISSKVSHRVFF